MVDVAVVVELKNDLVAVVDKRARLVDGAIPVAIKLSPNQPVEQVVLVDDATGASKTRARGTVAHREVSYASAIRRSLHKANVSLNKLSATRVIDLLQRATRELLSSDCNTDLDFTACLKADETNRTTSKQNRDYPRKKQPPSCGPPEVKTATKEQITRAREFL